MSYWNTFIEGFGKDIRGFSIIELAVVAAIVTIISVAAFVNFDFKGIIDESSLAIRGNLVGSVQAGVKTQFANNIASGSTSHPTQLDQGSNNSWCTASSPCLNQVSDHPYNDGRLYKYTNNCYAMDANENGAIQVEDNEDNPDWCLYYDSSSGIAGVWAGQNSLCTTSNCNASPLGLAGLSGGGDDGGEDDGDGDGDEDEDEDENEDDDDDDENEDEDEDDDEDEDEDDGDNDDEPKITICHDASGKHPKTMQIPQSAWGGHQVHGDLLGPCN